MSGKADTNGVTIEVFCNYTVVSDVGVNLTMIIVPGRLENKTQQKSFLCDKKTPSRVYFGNLEKDTLYDSLLLWISLDDMVSCTLSTRLKFKAEDGKIDTSNNLLVCTCPPFTGNLSGKQIIGTVAGCIIIIILLLIVLAVIILVSRKKCKCSF